MISVKKDYNAIPTKLMSSGCEVQKNDAILNKGKHKFKSAYYGLGCKSELVLLYNNKCCFCESDPSPSTFERVEHFRPKNKSPKKSPYGAHDGYYWLGYEWSNLLLICEKCNNKKSSHFPLFDNKNRIVNHPLDNENQLISNSSLELYLNEGNILLNPEIDPVEDYFIFKPDGDIVGLDDLGRGEISITLYNLRRENLILARKKIADDFFDEIKEALFRFNKSQLNETSLKDILNLKFSILLVNSHNRKLQYSRVWYFMFVKFEIFAKQYLPNDIDYQLIVKGFAIFNQNLKLS
ncbi:MAG: hypothetical protein IPM42_16365 [Saprospiraceae bacterium]|nr:hypothetical protein [Saprospiraceae bacterium]